MSDYVPFSIQAEIINRLPTKSLMQFRTVSKTWKSLIGSSKFVVDYSVNHTRQKHLLVSYLVLENLETKYVSIVDEDTFPQHKFSLTTPIPRVGMPIILGSSQGVFCLHSKGDPRKPENIIEFVLWNPCIRKKVSLSVPDMSDQPNGQTVIGFGVCPRTSDPKIVKINLTHSVSDSKDLICSPWQVQVYTLSSQAWRRVPTINQPRNTIQFLMQEQLVTDDYIYWLVVDGISIEMIPNWGRSNMIVSFDIRHERFMEISLPETLARAHFGNVVMCKLKESLVVVEAVKEDEKQVYGVWMMEHGVPNLFTKRFTIKSPDASITRVLGFRMNNEPIFLMRADDDSQDVFVHELRSEDLSYVGISGSGFTRALPYMETLLLIDH